MAAGGIGLCSQVGSRSQCGGHAGRAASRRSQDQLAELDAHKLSISGTPAREPERAYLAIRHPPTC